MEALLSSLTTNEQEAFVRFYSEGIPASKAIEGTGLSEEQFAEVRAEVRRRYQAAVSGLMDPLDWIDREQRLAARLTDIGQRRGVPGEQILEIIRAREALFAKAGTGR